MKPRNQRPGADSSWETMVSLFEQAFELSGSEREKLLSNAADPEVASSVQVLLANASSAERHLCKLGSDIGSIADLVCVPQPGDVLADRFLIARLIARGGMGEVYEARDLELGEVLALKVLRPELATSPEALERFRHEIRLARSVNNPHICRVHDLGRATLQSGELVFFTMELVAGETLKARILREGALELPLLRRIAGQLADGLDAAHKVGILHRDFKSGNVMIRPHEDGTHHAVITDFGLARTRGMPSETAFDGVMTPAYVAPEQLRGEAETEATDIYSLGVVLFEAATGRLPFEGHSADEIARARLSVAPKSPREFRPELDRKWESGLLRCLSLNPALRFPSAQEAVRYLGCIPGPAKVTRRLALAAAATAIPSMAVLYSRVSETSRYSLTIGPFEGGQGVPPEMVTGLAARVSDMLTPLPGITVIADVAAANLQKAGAKAKSSQITHALHGRVTKRFQGFQVRINLVSNTSGAQTWAATYDVDETAMEGIARQAGRGVISALNLSVLPAKLSTLDRACTKNQESYQKYLLGRYLAATRDTEALRESVTHFEQAVDLDPEFALAYAGLSSTLSMLWPKQGIPREETVARSNKAAVRALELNAGLAEPHAVLGSNLEYWNWDFVGAERHFRQAAELGPSVSVAHHWFAKMLYPLGRFHEALREIDRAIELDPFGLSPKIARGSVLLYMGLVAESVRQYEFVVAEDPGHSNGYVPLSCGYEAAGRMDDAIAAARRGVNLSSGASFTISQLAHLLALTRRDTEANELIAQLESRFPRGATGCDMARVHAGWQRSEQTLIWLERAIPNRDQVLTTLVVDPVFSFLKSDGRFKSLCRTLGIAA